MRAQLFFVAAWLCGVSLSLHSAQSTTPQQTPGAPPSAGAASPSVTVRGCVGGGANAEPFTLTDVSTVPPAESGAPTGTAGIASTPGTPGTAGTASTPGTSGTRGTPPVIGYRLLSKDDISSLVGKRVQVVGTVVPPTAPAGASDSATGTSAAASAGSVAQMPQLRVTSIEPIAGTCPQR
jgi:hypothetical protein